MFDIQDNIPPPAGIDGRTKYPFAQMDVGDSFAFPAERRFAVQSSASWYGKRNGKRFRVSAIGGADGRCWRIA